MTELVLLDRDGVINHDSLHYIKSVDEFILIPGAVEAIVRLTHAGYKIGIATNQSGVARGLYTESVLQIIHKQMIHMVERAGGQINYIEYCVHHPLDECLCRKPRPGMLYALAKYFDCPLKNVPFVGDRVSDIQAALTAGAEPVMVLSSMTDLIALKAYPYVPVFRSLAEYVDYFLSPKKS